jgi:polyisoprenyl-teichoic acid--peptidoglycan teichoic acid transferase
MAKMNIKTHKKKLLVIFSLIIMIISAVSTFVYVREGEKNRGGEIGPQVLSAQESNLDDGNLNDLDQVKNIDDVKTLSVLLLGYGGPGHSGAYLTDAIMIAHFNFETKKLAFISIPRDLWVTLPSGKSGKINQAFTMGDRSDMIHSGAQISKQMAEIITGIPIDYFVSIDFVGFQRAIGIELKNITVDVPVTLEDRWYPVLGRELEPCGKTPEEIAELTAKLSGFELEKQFPCRYDHILFPAGKNTMHGSEALAYVRSRHGSPGGDFSRSQRQKALLLGVRDRLFELDALGNIPGFFRQMIAHTNSDIDISMIEFLSPLLRTARDLEVIEVTLSTANVLKTGRSSSGQSIILPKSGMNDWGEVKGFVGTAIMYQ